MAFGSGTGEAAQSKSLTIGLVLVGPYNDQGWSQANYDGVQYVVTKVPGTKMVYIDKANSADRPGTTVSQLGESLVAQGAKLVIFSSDDMADEAVKFATGAPRHLRDHDLGQPGVEGREDLPGPSQHGEHHGPHGVRQDDRRRRRRHDHADRARSATSDRSSTTRPAAWPPPCTSARATRGPTT